MPTGSLCSERNVIGTALASDPALRRQDIRAVAVLSVTMPEAGGGQPDTRVGSIAQGARTMGWGSHSFLSHSRATARSGASCTATPLI